MRVRVLLQYALAAALVAAGLHIAGEYGGQIAAWVDAQGYVLESPAFLWVLLLIPFLIVVRAHTLSDLPRLQQALSLLLRSAIVAAIALALANPQERAFDKPKTATVFVVDVSDSIPDEALEKARQRIERTWLARGEQEVRVVVFAGQAQEMVLAPSQPAVPPLPRLDEGEGGESGPATDVQGALRLAFGLFPEDKLPRLVLITDGLETRGSVMDEGETARRFGIPIHYVDLTDVPRPAELMVTHVQVPADIKAKIPFGIKGTIEATEPSSATCEVQLDGIVAETREVTLEAGENPFEAELKVATGGDHRVALACRGDEDRFASNNRYEVAIAVPEKPKILYVEGERRYSRNLLAALDRDFDIEVRGARGIPASLADANEFDAIFISDVPRVGDYEYVNCTTNQMQVLDAYARAGGGIVFAGGEASFGPGGYTGTLLERKVLPVRLSVQKKEDIPGLALVLVVDRSGSMSGAKLELAKEAARATLEVLQPADKLGVIAFDSAPTSVVKLQRASNRLKITDSLARLSPGGGTAIFPALDMAYQTLASTPAKVKHIILLTDGRSSPTGVLELVGQSYMDKITISTVAVGNGSDQTLLMQIAEEGGGRYYFTDRADNIPKLFLKETSEVTRRALVEDRFRPVLSKRFAGLQMFRGIDLKNAPPLLGYVSTAAKPEAEVLMTSHLGEPIMARWRLGLGRVLVWTSDIKNKWAHAWLSWPGYAQFWRQVLRDNMRVEQDAPVLSMVADVAEGVLTVGVDAVDREDHFIDGLDSDVTVVGPEGDEHRVALEQVAAGRYEGKLALESYGPYTIRGRHHPTGGEEGESETFESRATVVWPFPGEHLVGEPDLGEVRRLAALTGGSEDPADAILFDPGDARIEKRTARWPAPLYVVLALLVLDVLLRRIRFYGKTRVRWAEIRGKG